MSNKRLGVIGLGAVGGRLARRLLVEFGALEVHDQSSTQCDALVAAGARASDSPRQMAQCCNTVLLSLPSPAAVESVMQGQNGLLQGVHEKSIVLDTSTLDPATSRYWAERVSSSGGCYLDTPVTCAVTQGGGTAAVETGELTVLVGGDEGAFARAHEVLDVIGRRIHYLGAAGAGSVMKLVSNHISGIQTLAIAEALSLAEVCGFDARRTLEVCADTVANSYVMESIVAARLDTMRDETHFAIELMRKDHRLAATLAAQHDVPLPMNQTALELCDRMCAAGYAKRDNVSAFEYFREMTTHKP
ncbi:MAG: hypothetical protein CMO26_00880 [Thiotrichales bacterium]|nr:hypothetical protein [Thiotrichales bacterium]